MTDRTLDRWLGYGVLLVIALTAVLTWWVHGQAGKPPVVVQSSDVTVLTSAQEYEPKPIPPLRAPCGITIIGTRFYIVGDRDCVAVPRNGVPQRYALPINTAPTAMASDGQVNIYIGLGDHIGVYHAGWQRITEWPARAKMHITGLAVGKDAVWAADAGNKVVVGYDFTGKVIATLGAKDAAKGVPGLETPGGHLDVAVTPTGEIAVTNPGRHQIEFYDKTGKLLRRWGKASGSPGGFSGCCNPVALTVLRDGSVVTAEKGQSRLQRFSADGIYRETVAVLKSGSDWDMTTINGCELVLLDVKSKCIRLYAMSLP